MSNTYIKEQIEKYREEIKNICYSHPDNFSRILKSDKYKYLYDFIMWFTKDMREREYLMSTLCYWVIHNIRDWNNDLVVCRNPSCRKPLKDKEARVIRGYIRSHCSRSCSQADPAVYNKINQVKIKKYGSKNNYNKIRSTRIKKYGTAGAIAYAYEYNSILFDSLPELAFFIYLKDHNISFEYQPKISFEYYFNGTIHHYFPDFLINKSNEIIDLKGDQFFKDGKMIDPYDNKNEKAQAKYECMIKNNIKIITSKEYKTFTSYIDQKYGKNYLIQFKLNRL